MKKVYFCHPFKSNQAKNIALVKQAVIACREIFPDILPIAPHLYLPNFFNEETERDEAMQACISLVNASKEQWVFITPEGTTSGMRIEIDRAKAIGMQVREVVFAIEPEKCPYFQFCLPGTIALMDIANTYAQIQAMQGATK